MNNILYDDITVIYIGNLKTLFLKTKNPSFSISCTKSKIAFEVFCKNSFAKHLSKTDKVFGKLFIKTIVAGNKN